MSGEPQSQNPDLRKIQTAQSLLTFFKEREPFKRYPIIVQSSSSQETELSFIEKWIKDTIQTLQTSAEYHNQINQQIMLINGHLHAHYLQVQLERLLELLQSEEISQIEKTRLTNQIQQAQQALWQASHDIRHKQTEKETLQRATSQYNANISTLEKLYQEAFLLAQKEAKTVEQKKAWFAIFATFPHQEPRPLGQLNLFHPQALKNLSESYSSATSRFRWLRYQPHAKVICEAQENTYQLHTTFYPFSNQRDSLVLDFIDHQNGGFSGYLENLTPEQIDVNSEIFINLAPRFFNAYLIMFMTAERALIESATYNLTSGVQKKLPFDLYLDLPNISVIDDTMPAEQRELMKRKNAFIKKQQQIAKAAYDFFQIYKRGTQQPPVLNISFLNAPPELTETPVVTLNSLLPKVPELEEKGIDLAKLIEQGAMSLLDKYQKSCEKYFKQAPNIFPKPEAPRSRPSPQ